MKSEELNNFCNNYYNWWRLQQCYDDSGIRQNENNNNFDDFKLIVFLNRRT